MQKLRGIFIGKLFRIPVYIHPTWFVTLFLLTFTVGGGFLEEGSTSAVLAYATAFLVAIVAFATLLAHEYGHALAARYFGIPTQRITLFLLGGIAQIRGELRKPIEEFVIALAGPVVSVGCMILFGIIWALASYANAPQLLTESAALLTLINFGFAAFNMLPGFPMDGGRVFRSLVWAATGNFLTATRVAFAGTIGVAGLLAAWGIFGGLSGFSNGIMPILTAFFLVYIGKQSLKEAQVRAAFDNVSVRDLMRPVQAVVPAELSLRRVVHDFIYRIHADRFPVVRGNMLLGYISADDIAAVDRMEWDQRRAEQYVRPFGRSEILSPEQNALHAFQKVQSLGRSQLPVFRNRELVGYLVMQDVLMHMRRFHLT